MNFLILFIIFSVNFVSYNTSNVSYFPIPIYNITSGQLKYLLEKHTAPVYSLSRLGEGLMASGSHDSTICIWNLTTGQLNRTLIKHTDTIVSLVSLDTHLLASIANADENIYIWNTTNGDIYRQTSLQSPAYLLRISDTLLVVGSWYSVIAWDFINNKTFTLIDIDAPFIMHLAKVNANMFASIDLFGNVSIWNLTTKSVQSSFSIFRTGDLLPPFVSLNEQLIAVASNHDNEIKSNIIVYDVTQGKVKSIINITDGKINALQNLNENKLAGISFNKTGSTLNVWNVVSGQLEHAWLIKGVELTSTIHFNNGNILALVSNGNESTNSIIFIYDLLEKKLKFTLETSLNLIGLINEFDEELLGCACGWLCN